jgi:hypothetical protein
MTSPNANPTPITPPRVPLIDERTGLIDRAWYMFFLSLFNAAQSAADESLSPDALTFAASLEAAVNSLRQEAQTQPSLAIVASLEAAVDALRQELQTQPTPDQLRPLIDDLAQRLNTLPQPQLGTMAALQQANVPWVTFDETPQSVPPTVGTVAWDGGTTLGVQATTNVLIRVGESEYIYAKASAAITKGQVCYHTGSVGSSGVITAAPTPLALADPNQIVGVAAETIALNGFGLIQISGDLRGFNTTGASVGEVWADGDALYYNPAFVGSFTKVKPSAPNQKTYMGEVTNAGSGGSGSIHVRIVQGTVLGGTDSNVQITSVADKNLLQYDSALGYWKNVASTSAAVTSFSAGTTGLTPATPTTGAVVLGGTLDVDNGGTGQSTYTTGDLLYASGSAALSKLGIGAVGQYLSSTGAAPQWSAPAALTKTDDTNVTVTLGGSASTALLNAASMTLGWTGQLAVSRGGTGVNTTPSNGQLLIGNGTGYTVANLTAGSGVSISNSAGGVSISATGTGGTVTSVGLSMPSQFTVTNSPVTTTGTLTAAWNNQTANYVFAGPTSGGAAAPAFRALVPADIPTNSATLPSAITPTGSPYTYQNTSAYSVDVLVSGGGVSALEFTRDNVAFYDTGSYYGMFTLSPNDRLRVTYSAAPTMTLIPR